MIDENLTFKTFAELMKNKISNSFGTYLKLVLF